MKKTTFILGLILSTILSHATIRRCNNASPVSGVYATAQAAHDAANPGDTIHLEPSAQGSYGTLTVTKPIVLISTGDYIAQNPGYQSALNPGYCDNIYIQTGGENTVISARVTNQMFIQTNNVIVTHARIAYIYIYGSAPLTNIAISKSVIDYLIYNYTPCSNLIFNNNYMAAINLNNGASGIISNNVINNSNYYSISNCTLSNNIFISSYYPYTFSNCISNNNISSLNDLPSVNGNFNNVNMANVFINWAAFTGDNYQLLPSYASQNLGMFAGSDPYKVACTPAIPSIYQLIVPSSSTGTSLNITVSTRSNN